MRRRTGFEHEPTLTGTTDPSQTRCMLICRCCCTRLTMARPHATWRHPDSIEGEGGPLDPETLPPIPSCFGDTTSTFSQRELGGTGFGKPKPKPSYKLREELPMPGAKQLIAAQRLMYGHSSLSAKHMLLGEQPRNEKPQLMRRKDSSLSVRGCRCHRCVVGLRARAREAPRRMACLPVHPPDSVGSLTRHPRRPRTTRLLRFLQPAGVLVMRGFPSQQAGKAYRQRVMERRSMPTLQLSTVQFGCDF